MPPRDGIRFVRPYAQAADNAGRFVFDQGDQVEPRDVTCAKQQATLYQPGKIHDAENGSIELIGSEPILPLIVKRVSSFAGSISVTLAVISCHAPLRQRSSYASRSPGRGFS